MRRPQSDMRFVKFYKVATGVTNLNSGHNIQTTNVTKMEIGVKRP